MCGMQTGPEIILLLLILSIAVEALTEIIVESKLFEPIRINIKRMAYKTDEPPLDTYFQSLLIQIDYLFSCGYCVSVWVSAIISIYASYSIADWLIITLFNHRISNVVHVVYELISRGRIQTLDVTIKKEQQNLDIEG